MKLSMSMIYTRLSGYEREAMLQHDGMTIQGVRFLAGSRTSYSPDYVYVGAASGYFQDPGFSDAMILTSGQNSIICRGADNEDLLNDTLAAFEHYNRAEQQLFECAAKHYPVKDMIQPIEKLLPFPMYIFAIDGRLLGAAHQDLTRVDEFTDDVLKTGTLGAATLGNVFLDDRGMQSHDLSDKPQIMRIQGRKTSCIGMYIMQDTERVGFVLYFPPEDKAELSTGVCLEPLICSYLADADEFTQSGSEHLSKRMALSQMLAGERLSGAALSRFLCQSGFAEDTPGAGSAASRRFVLLLLETLTIQNHTFRTMIMSELEGCGAPAVCCELENRIAVLLEKDMEEQVQRALSRRIPQENLKTGVSLPSSDIYALPHMLAQADFALGASDSPGIRRAEDLALPYLITALRSNPICMELLHPALSELEAYDAANDSEMKKTLAAYLDAGCSQNAAAQALNVHLNTLKYRLKRIHEICGTDLSDPQELFYLQLSFKI